MDFRDNQTRAKRSPLKAEVSGQDVKRKTGNSGRPPIDLRENGPFLHDPALECCPSGTELSNSFLGINFFGKFVELYHTEDKGAQKFFETICLQDVKDRPCQFVADRFVRRSRCVQQYSYTYAFARDPHADDKRFRIDLIRVATGCKCHLDPE